MSYNRKLAEYVNEKYQIRDLYLAITGRVPGNGKIFCPVHNNKNTPAAKIYGNALKCFGVCNCLYKPYDLMKIFFPEELVKIKESIVLPEVNESRVKFVYKQRKDIKGTSLYEVLKEVSEYEENNN